MLAEQIIIQPVSTGEPKRRKGSLSINFFSLEEKKDSFSPKTDSKSSSTHVLDIVSHEVRTPLHTMRQSLKCLKNLGNQLQKPGKTTSLIDANIYLCYIETSLKRLTTFIKTGQPADYERSVGKEKIFSDISLKAIAPLEELEKAMKDLQQNTPLSIPVNQIDSHLKKIEIHLDALTQPMPTKNTTLSSQNNSAVSSPPPCKVDVLIVDDNEINAKLLLKILQKKKCHVDIAYNGAEAVKLFSRGKYDVIFMDINMPIMDGYQATQNIRDIETKALAPETPIIALTANANTAENKDKATAAGMNDFLSKPYESKHIYQLMKKYSPYKDVPSPVSETSSLTSAELETPPSSPIKIDNSTGDITSSFSQLPFIGLMGSPRRSSQETRSDTLFTIMNPAAKIT